VLKEYRRPLGAKGDTGDTGATGALGDARRRLP